MEEQTNIPNIQKMVFLYNALNDGWTIKKTEKNTFELSKEKQYIKKEIVLDECIKDLINFKKNEN